MSIDAALTARAPGRRVNAVEAHQLSEAGRALESAALVVVRAGAVDRFAALGRGVARDHFTCGERRLASDVRLPLEAHSSSSRSAKPPLPPFPPLPRKPDFGRRRRRRSFGSHTSQCPQGVGSPSSK